MIEVKNLNKTFKTHLKEPGLKGSVKGLFVRKSIERHALSDINLQVNKGEVLGLIGSNGAGKTTLTKILAGIIHPTSGSVEVFGHIPFKRNNIYRKQMSLIMGQKAQLWWDLPALDGFLLLKEIYQIDNQIYNDSINFLGDLLNIKDHLKTQVRKLSLGERMKVELMAALLHRPQIVYLDEPTIGLDLMAQRAVRDFIKHYQKEFSPIMILTSHYMEDIKELCERIAILKDGKKIYDGKLKTIVNEYSTHQVIRANFSSLTEVNIFKENFPEELGTISISENSISLHIHKNNITNAATYLLKNLAVTNLSIIEDDVSDVIEKIMLEKQAQTYQ